RWDVRIVRDMAQVERHPVRPPPPLEAARREPSTQVARTTGIQCPARDAAQWSPAAVIENAAELLARMRAREARKHDRRLAAALLRAPDPGCALQSEGFSAGQPRAHAHPARVIAGNAAQDVGVAGACAEKRQAR